MDGLPIATSLPREVEEDRVSAMSAAMLSLGERIASELGADAVKTDYSGDPSSMRAVVEGCYIPILVLGGSRHGSDEDALEVVRGATLAGAAGVIFGRNVFQAADMQSFLRQARSLLDGADILSPKR